MKKKLAKLWLVLCGTACLGAPAYFYTTLYGMVGLAIFAAILGAAFLTSWAIQQLMGSDSE